MKTYTIANFKAQFTSVLTKVQKGNTVIITKGKQKKHVAILTGIQTKKRAIGILKGKATFSTNNWTITDKELGI